MNDISENKIIYKLCRDCQEKKEIKEFYKHRAICKKCLKEKRNKRKDNLKNENDTRVQNDSEQKQDISKNLKSPKNGGIEHKQDISENYINIEQKEEELYNYDDLDIFKIIFNIYESYSKELKKIKDKNERCDKFIELINKEME